ncbi:hypothetical protein KUCAC02_028413, partial [Chaenocephalus aceratus]
QESRQVHLKLLHGLERPESSEEQEKEEESEIADEEERPNKDEGDGARDLHIDGICPNDFPDILGDVQVLLIRYNIRAKTTSTQCYWQTPLSQEAVAVKPNPDINCLIGPCLTLSPRLRAAALLVTAVAGASSFNVLLSTFSFFSRRFPGFY